MDFKSPMAFWAFAITVFASCAMTLPHRDARQTATPVSFFNTASPSLATLPWNVADVIDGLRLARMLRELPSKLGDLFSGRRPVRVTCVAVEHQRAGLQRVFEFLLIESDRLIVVVWTVDFKFQAVAHKPS
jgi:hypothetical protein